MEEKIEELMDLSKLDEEEKMDLTRIFVLYSIVLKEKKSQNKFRGNFIKKIESFINHSPSKDYKLQYIKASLFLLSEEEDLFEIPKFKFYLKQILDLFDEKPFQNLDQALYCLAFLFSMLQKEFFFDFLEKK